MTFSTPWLGAKKVAFVPLFRTNAAPPDEIPPDWENLIEHRVINDPRPEADGADRSLRAWLRTVSWGRADIDPLVLPMQTIDRHHVEADDLEGRLGASLRAQGVQSAILIMLGDRGAGTNRGFWSRAVMRESNGVWLMEIIHSLTNFADLYHFRNDVDPEERGIRTFDEMSQSSQTHPTAFTKNELGWLDTRKIGLYNPARAIRTFTRLQPISANPPSQLGELFAIRIGDGFPYVMVEARKKTDQFEAGMLVPDDREGQEIGIASEGVIAYRVQTRNPTVQEREGFKKPLYLMTLTALQPGESIELDNFVILKVEHESMRGFHIDLSTAPTTVPNVISMTAFSARRAIERVGLRPNQVGPSTNSTVWTQSPEGGNIVPRFSSVTFHMERTDL